MTFGIRNTINCINASANRLDLSPLEILQLTGSGCEFQKTPVFSVACEASLPLACDNTGRFIFIENLRAYRFSDGQIWTNDTSGFYPTTAWAWGYNGGGRLGDNSIINRSSPISVVGGFTDWCQISAGYHSLAVRQNGTAWAWGYNYFGQLGDNTSTQKSSPVSVVGGFTDWCQISARYHSLAVRQNGTAWAWGFYGAGRLGDNSTTARSSPVSVVGGFTDWCQVSAGSDHSLAVRQNGTAWAWGCNVTSQLGDNTTTNRSSPVSVVGGFTDWCQVSGGNNHSLAVRQNGTAWAWGYNGTGQLGDNSITSRSSPVSVVGGFTDWCQVSGGDRHSLAVRQNGTAWSWGSNGNGRLGDNSVTSRLSPVSVVGGFTDWCQISGGDRHSLAVRQNGTAWAWGCNATGQLGDNSTTQKSSPVSVVGGFTDWCQISGGQGHSLALRAGGEF